MPANFTRLQATAERTGTTTVAITCSAITASSLIVVTLASSSLGAFSPPGSNWRLAKSYAAGNSAGHQEIWYLEPKYNAGGQTSFTFSGTTGAVLRGGLTEHSVPSGYTVILEATGVNKGGASSGTTMSLLSSCGTAADCLGIVQFADFFSASVGAGPTWTAVAGWSTAFQTASGAAVLEYVATNEDMGQGNHSPGSGFSTTTNVNGWCAVFAAFRALRFEMIHADGAEMLNFMAQSPDGQTHIIMGDVEGQWRTADAGDHFQVAMANMYADDWAGGGSVAWSIMPGEAQSTVYALVGRFGGTDGRFLVSADGGSTWTPRSSAVQVWGNATRVPPRPTSEPQDSDRSVGHLIAQDPVNNYIYACDTTGGGVMRSHDLGNTWTPIGLNANSGAANGQYLRAVVVDPNNPKHVWACCWDNGGFGGVYYCSDGTTAPQVTSAVGASWNLLGGFTGTVADLMVMNGFLYAACNKGGMYRATLPGGNLQSLNGDKTTANLIVDGTSKWNSVDGFVKTNGDHVVLAGVGDAPKPSGKTHYQFCIQMTIPSTYPASGSITYKDLSNVSGGSVNVSTIPPDSRPFWHGPPASWQFWLGGNNSTNIHVFVDVLDNTIFYATGPGGFYRSFNSGTDWQLCCNGMPMIDTHCVKIDPLNANHYVVTGSDFATMDLTDPSGLTNVQTGGMTISGPHVESHGVWFDQANSDVFLATNEAYGANSQGFVMARAGANQTGPWYDTGLHAITGGNAVIGVYMDRDAGGQRFILAVVQGKGIYRGTSSVGISSNNWNWTAPTAGSPAASVSGAGNVGQHVPFTSDGGPHIYVFDRKQGVLRSTDYGLTWKLIFSKTTNNSQTGWVACNPSQHSDVWVSTNDNPHGLYRISNAAGTTPTITNITTGVPDPGGIGFFKGNVYVVWLPNSGHTQTQLMISTDNGTTWADVGAPEVGQYIHDPLMMDIHPSGRMVLLSDQNVGMTGLLGGGGGPPPPPALSVGTSGTLTQGTVGSSYTYSLAANSGTPPYTWQTTVVTGALPGGLAIAADGTISGTPNAAGTFTFTVRVTDSTTPTAQTATSGTLTIKIVAAGTTVGITTTSVANGVFGQPYSATISASGGTTPYTWLVTGSLPQGVTSSTVSNQLVIQGTPTKFGTFAFQAQVSDSSTPIGSDIQGFSITIPSTGMSIVNTILPNALTGIEYTAALTGSGGSPPYTWSIVVGSTQGVNAGDDLPLGLSLDDTAGLITGVTVDPGLVNIAFQMADTTGSSVISVIPLRVLLGFTAIPPMPAGSVASADDMNKLSAAANFLLGKPVARVHDNTGGQTVGITAAPVSFDTEDIDNDGIYDPTQQQRLTIQTPGWYKFNYAVVTSGTNTVNAYIQSVSGSANPQGAGVNSGSQWASYAPLSATAVSSAGASGLWPYYLYPGDYLKVYAVADTAGNKTDVSVSPSFFGIEFVSV